MNYTFKIDDNSKEEYLAYYENPKSRIYHDALIINSLSELPKILEKIKDRGIAISIELKDNIETDTGVEYAIYEIQFLDDDATNFIERGWDMTAWNYAIKIENIRKDLLKINKQ